MRSDLKDQVDRFADDVTSTLQAVLGEKDVELQATMLDERFTVSTPEPSGITLCVDRKPLLRLAVKFECGWDSKDEFVAVDTAEFHVFTLRDREALFRYEFVRNMRSPIPCAHLQIHGHRDALAYAMTRAGKRTTRSKRRADGAPPRMDELHFPLGGARFRPALEDVLQMLVEEFGVDAVDGWRKHLAQGRERWRRIQTRAVVRDAPDEAVATLRALGYLVTEPEGEFLDANIKRLQSI